MGGHQHPANIARHDELSWWGRLPDRLTGVIGTMRFICGAGVVIGGWITLNVVAWVAHWDPNPFQVLNLVISVFSLFTGPLVLMSQSRQSEHDRVRAEHDYGVNEEALAWSRAVGAHLGVELPGPAGGCS